MSHTIGGRILPIQKRKNLARNSNSSALIKSSSRNEKDTFTSQNSIPLSPSASEASDVAKLMKTQKLLESISLRTSPESLEFRNDKNRMVKLNWLTMRAPQVGTAKHAERPVLHLADPDASESHTAGENMIRSEMQTVADYINLRRLDALDAQDKKLEAEAKRGRDINARLAANAKPVNYSSPAASSSLSSGLDRYSEYNIANSRRSDGSYFNTSLDDFGAGARARFDMGL